MAKYRIKDPRFAIHLQKVETVEMPNGQKRRTLSETSHYAGPTIELSDEDALSHMHKIDPVCDAAKALWKDFHDTQDRHIAARRETLAAPPISAEAIAAAVVKSLADAGMLRPPRN